MKYKTGDIISSLCIYLIRAKIIKYKNIKFKTGDINVDVSGTWYTEHTLCIPFVLFVLFVYFIIIIINYNYSGFIIITKANYL